MKVRPLGQEDPLEGMTTHSSILAQRSLAGYSPRGCKQPDTHTHTHTHTHRHTHILSIFILKNFFFFFFGKLNRLRVTFRISFDGCYTNGQS